MSQVDVLLVGSEGNERLMDSLFAAGVAVLVRDSIESAVAALRSEPFRMVLVDGTTARADSLELLLNIRDIRPGVPVAFVAPVGEPGVRDLLERDAAVDIAPELEPTERIVDLVRRSLGNRRGDEQKDERMVK